jgi:heat shock protein HspQ
VLVRHETGTHRRVDFDHPTRHDHLMSGPRVAKFSIGQIVRHRFFAFRGVIFDVDPVFANTDEWYNAIPSQMRPRKDQPFYHLLAENAETEYVAYVSEQNLVTDPTQDPVRHPQVQDYFEGYDASQKTYRWRGHNSH